MIFAFNPLTPVRPAQNSFQQVAVPLTDSEALETLSRFINFHCISCLHGKGYVQGIDAETLYELDALVTSALTDPGNVVMPVPMFSLLRAYASLCYAQVVLHKVYLNIDVPNKTQHDHLVRVVDAFSLYFTHIVTL